MAGDNVKVNNISGNVEKNWFAQYTYPNKI